MRINLLALTAALMLAACGGGESTTTSVSPQASPNVQPTDDNSGGGQYLPPPTSVEADIYVDPAQGNDTASGTRDAPVKGLVRAQALVRQLKAAEPARQTPIVVLLRGGTYTLNETLQFGTQDSGTETAPIIYRAHPSERPVVSGGVLLSGWNVDANGRWQLRIPEVVSNGWAFTQLWSDGQRRWRPRLPKDSYRFIRSKVAPLNETRDNRFGFYLGDIDPTWRNLSDVEVLTWHHWAISRLRIAAVDVPNTIVTFTGPTRCPSKFCELLPTYRYIVENVFEALRDPGEWYLDSSSGQLTYLPFPGENPDDTIIIVPRLQTLVRIQGEGFDSQAAHIAFEGISFAHTNWQTPASGYSAQQGDSDLGAAIELRYANDIRFSGCSIEHTGEYGIAIRDGSHRNRIEGCLLSDLGSGGIRVGTEGRRDIESEVTSHNVIRDNLIISGGRVHPSGVGVLIQSAAHNIVEHNDIFDFYYTGISVGWRWGQGPSNAHDNDIGYNYIERIGQRVLSDLGGIYTLGTSPGTRVHHNILQDISRYRYGGWGLYGDAGSSEILFEKNLVYGTQDAPFALNHGRNVTLKNNILIADNSRVLERGESVDNLAITVRSNILVSNKQEILEGAWSDGQYTLNSNLYWTNDAPPPTFNGQSMSEWQTSGQDLNSLVADPLFIDPSQRNYTVTASSPATTIGIAAIDLSNAGRRLLPRAHDLPLASPAFPPGGPQPLNINFEDMNVGGVPTQGKLGTSDDAGSSVLVSATAAAMGTEKSLHFLNPPPYDLRTDHDTGTYRLAFSLRWLDNSTITVALRDWSSNPFIAGPAMNVIRDGRIEIGGNTLTKLNSGQWTRFEIIVPLGIAADGTFTLTVTPEGSATQSFPGQRYNTGFDRVTYVGIYSDVTPGQNFFVDEIHDYVE